MEAVPGMARREEQAEGDNHLSLAGNERRPALVASLGTLGLWLQVGRADV